MRKVFIFSLLIMFSFSLSFANQYISIDQGGQTNQLDAQLISSDQNSSTIELDVDGILLEDIDIVNSSYSNIYWENSGVEGELGEATLPVYRFFLQIPYGAKAEIELLESEINNIELSSYGIQNPLYPVQPPREKVEGAVYEFVMDESYYKLDSYKNLPIVEVTDYPIIRGHQLVSIIVRPVDYNPAIGELSFVSNLKFKVDYQGGNQGETIAKLQRYSSRQSNHLVEEIVLNPGVFEINELDDLPTSLGYLIISENNVNYLEAMESYVEWKKDMGYEVTMVSTVETGTSNSDIRDYIQDAYDTWDVPPSFVLLIGDTPEIPHFTGQGTGSPPTDLNYSMMEGNDYFPDIGVGRFSVANLTDLNNVIDKTLQYEQGTWGGGDDWVQTAVFMASTDNYQISEGTHNFVLNNYLNDAGFDSDLLYTVTYNATTQDVTDSFNAGRNLGIYSGHGSTTSWADGPAFSQANVNALTNTVYPFVQSYACITGNFTYGECFAETWIRTDNGAFAFMGSSVNSYWDEDDIMEKRVFEGFFDNQIPGDPYNFTWINGLVNYGKIELYSYYGNTGMVRRYFEMYNIMGDGSVDLWTSDPAAVTVTHPTTMIIGMDAMDVNVAGAPSWAMVCLRSLEDETICASGYTDEFGDITLTLGSPLTTPGTLMLHVTGHDVEHYEAEVTVIPADGMYPIVQSFEVDDNPGNGQAEYGEEFDLVLNIENMGNETIDLLEVEVETTSPWLTIDAGVQTAENIAQNDVVAVEFASSVDLYVPNNEGAQFNVTMTAGLETWEQDFTLFMYAPELDITIIRADDAAGNGNQRLEAGENGSLDLLITNNGGASIQAEFNAEESDAYLENLLVNLGLVNLPAGGSVEYSSAIDLEVSALAPDMERAWIYCTIDRLDGFTWSDYVDLDLGGVYDDMEGVDQGWSHYANPGYSDDWHVSSEMNYTPGGDFSWKAGDTGVGDYSNDLDACLELPVLNVPGQVVLSFNHRINAEISAYWTGECYDGGRVEVSTDGINWTGLPMPGYNYTTRGNGPFGEGISVYSGTIAWESEEVLIDSDPGDLHIRFRFGSDGAVTDEGWYVDDISVVLPGNLTPPANLLAEVVEDGASLTWNTPGGELDDINLLGFTVYRDGSPVSGIIQQSDYLDDLTMMPNDNYNYTVTSVYEEGESIAAGPIQVTWGDFDLILSATPQNPPIFIQAWGGSFTWDAFVENQSGGQYTFDAWTELVLPNGNTYGPLNLFENLVLPDGGTITASPIQVVPAGAPNGYYTYVAKVGDYPNAIAVDGFEFGKLPVVGALSAGTDSPEDWVLSGWFDDMDVVDKSIVLPSEFTIEDIYPNPFNPSTSIEVALPESGVLMVNVYNIMGQTVQTLVSGRVEAGYNSFVFDGTGLSSGIYFVQAVVPGKMDICRKVVLLK